MAANVRVKCWAKKEVMTLDTFQDTTAMQASHHGIPSQTTFAARKLGANEHAEQREQGRESLYTKTSKKDA